MADPLARDERDDHDAVNWTTTEGGSQRGH
jgi:hypothetical protein